MPRPRPPLQRAPFAAEESPLDTIPLAQVDPAAVEALLDRAFGADRHTRTAYRLRAGLAPVAALSRAVIADGALVASLQCWPVALAADDGRRHPLTLVGPVAVAPERQQAGLGRALMTELIATTGAEAPLILVGDPEYYDRFFGFTAARTGRWRLPGPFEPRRLLARGPVPDIAGLVVPDPGR